MVVAVMGEMATKAQKRLDRGGGDRGGSSGRVAADQQRPLLHRPIIQAGTAAAAVVVVAVVVTAAVVVAAVMTAIMETAEVGATPPRAHTSPLPLAQVSQTDRPRGPARQTIRFEAATGQVPTRKASRPCDNAAAAHHRRPPGRRRGPPSRSRRPSGERRRPPAVSRHTHSLSAAASAGPRHRWLGGSVHDGRVSAAGRRGCERMPTVRGRSDGPPAG